MKVLVAVPALNEAAALGQVLDSLAAVHPLRDVVVVDDGSSDATARIAREAGAHVISHAINLGVGAAMGTAFKYAARAGYDAVLQFDGDGQHRPEYIVQLVAALADADLVIGSRYADVAGYKSSAARRGVQRFIARVASLYARTRLTDATSGFRIAGPRAVAVFAEHYPVEWLGDTVESIVLATRQGLRVREISVGMNERAGGVPSQSIFRASMYTGRILFILGLASIRSVPTAGTRRAPSRGEGIGMTPQLLAIAMAVVLLFAVILLLRSYVLPEKYAVIWILASVVAIVLSAWPGLLTAVSTFFGISSPINLLFVGAFFVVFLLLMQVTLELARTRDELRRVVQQIALEQEERAKPEA